MPTDQHAHEGRGRAAARWLLIAFYAVAGIAHLTFATDAMVGITPAWVPFPRIVVLATGLCELAGAAGLATSFDGGRWRRAAGWGLAAYAVCVFPANIQHAIRDLSTHRGLGWGYHAPRLVLQPLIVWWALWASGAVRGGHGGAAKVTKARQVGLIRRAAAAAARDHRR